MLVIIVFITNSQNIETFDVNDRTAFVINLDKRPERMEQMYSKFNDYLRLKRVSAIEHKKGIIGCGLSHMKVVRMARNLELSTVLILEDDCKPTVAFQNWFPIKFWLDNNLDKWDIFTGGNCYYYYTSLFHKSRNTVKSICKLNDDIKLYYTRLMCTQFVYINSRAYDKYLSWEQYSKEPIDMWPDKVNMITISCVPFLAIQEDGYSDINNNIKSLDNAFLHSEKYISEVPNLKDCEL